MTVIQKSERTSALRQLGISTAVLFEEDKKPDHPFFSLIGAQPSYYLYHTAIKMAGVLIPLWDHADIAVAVHHEQDQYRFIAIPVEAPENCQVLSRTEQGLWLTQFDQLYELDYAMERLQEIAQTTKFMFLADYLTAREDVEETLGTFTAKKAWLASMVESVDAQAKHI